MKYEFDFRRLLTAFSLISAAAVLSGCGGGGGDEGQGGGGPHQPPPVAISSSSASSASSQLSSAESSSVSSVSSSSSSAMSSLPAKPSTPNSLQATSISATQVTLVWQNPVTDVANVRITRNGQVIDTIEGNLTRYSDATLAPENQYTYRVQTSDRQGNWSPLSTGLSIRTAPAAGNNGGLTNNSSSINNDWGSVSSVSSWSSSSSSWSSWSSSSVSSSSVSSSSASSITSSSSSSVADKLAPTVPYGLKATSIKDVSIDLHWDAATDDVAVTLYRVLRDGEVVATVSGSSQDYLDLELEPDTRYTYTVQAGDAAGNWSANSAPITVRTTAVAKEGGVLTWSHPTERENGEYLELDEIGGYELRYRENSLKPFTNVIIRGSDTTSYDLDKLRANYDFEIAVFDAQGLYSEFVTITPR